MQRAGSTQQLLHLALCTAVTAAIQILERRMRNEVIKTYVEKKGKKDISQVLTAVKNISIIPE